MTRLEVALMVGLAVGRAEAEPAWDARTVVAQSAAGTAVLVGGSGLFLLSSFCGFMIDDKSDNDCFSYRVLALGIATLTIAGTIASVQLVGYAMDGTGSLVGSSLGFGVGFGVGVGLGYGISRITNKFLPVAAAVLLPMVAGAVIGYHLSADLEMGAAVRVPLMSLSF